MTNPAQAETESDPNTDTEEQPTLLEQMGGVSGLIYSSVPVLVFVLVNALTSLYPAIWAALGSAVVIAVVRIVRKQRVLPAVSGAMGVGVAAFIAYRTGTAKGFFLFGIWASLIYGGVFATSILVRWPLVGVIWSALEGRGRRWRKDRPSLIAFDVATLTFVVVFGARYVVQRWLYEENLTGWLAFAKIAMGYPLFAVALAVTVWAVRRAAKRDHEFTSTQEAANKAAEARLRAKYGEQATDSA